MTTETVIRWAGDSEGVELCSDCWDDEAVRELDQVTEAQETPKVLTGRRTA